MDNTQYYPVEDDFDSGYEHEFDDIEEEEYYTEEELEEDDEDSDDDMELKDFFKDVQDSNSDEDDSSNDNSNSDEHPKPSQNFDASENSVPITYKDDGHGEIAMFDDSSLYDVGCDFDGNDQPDSNKKNTGLSYEEELTVYASKIFGSILSGKDGSKEQLDYFKDNMPPELFRDENFLIAKVLHKSMRNKIISPRQFNIILHAQISKIPDYDHNYIKLSNYKEVGGSKVKGLLESATSKYESYLNSASLMEFESFKEDIGYYRMIFQHVAYEKSLQVAQEILTQGITIGKKSLIGPESMALYLRKSMAEISGLMEVQEGRGFVSMREDLEDSGDTRSELLYDFPTIPTLQKNIGGIYRGDFIQVMAPPKAGKSKLCQRISYEMIKLGHNVTVWPEEGGHKAWTASMRAMHCEWYHNSRQSTSTRYSNLPTQGDIIKGRMSEEVAKLEKVSRENLKDNKSFGTVDYIDKSLKLETFLDDLETSILSNNSKAVFIDYLQLISSDNSRKANHEVIAQAYKSMLQFCSKLNVAVITPVQFKQEVVAQFANEGKDSKQDMRVAASGSSEVIRTPDYTMVLYANTADLQNGVATLKSMPNRFSQTIPDIKLDTDLAYNIFAEAKV